MPLQIIIIGAGAAGCFAAIQIKRLRPEAQVTVLEKLKRPLAKVAITGGGRCNLTNSFAQVKSLEQVYPRGFRLMKKLFHHFSHEDAYQWFEDNGIRLITQEDECVFPASQDAMEIVNYLTREMKNLGVKLLTDTQVDHIIDLSNQKTDGNSDSSASAVSNSPTGFCVKTNRGEMKADKVLVTTGGHPTGSGYRMLQDLDLEIIPSHPSLFSFNLSDEHLKSLMGTVVKDAIVFLPGTKLKAEGALLITHWGISGPAALKLSAYGARILAEQNYVTDISIRWLTDDQETIMQLLHELSLKHRDKKLTSVYPEAFNARLWEHLLMRANLSVDMRWKELSNKDINRLINTLTNDIYHVTGKNRFKDEFVTSGGVSLSSLKHKTLEAKNHPGLHFAGEVTDVDAITGGFNLQAAWSMAYVAAHAMTE